MYTYKYTIECAVGRGLMSINFSLAKDKQPTTELGAKMIS